MKRKWFISVMLVLMMMFMVTSCVDVDPGYVGVRVWKRGVNAGEIEILDVGRHSLSIKASDTFFPTYKQNYVWTADENEGSRNDESLTFPIEGLKITIDVGIEFEVVKSEVGTIYSDYRLSLGEITDGPIRNYVRDAVLAEVKAYSSMEKFITDNEISELITKVEARTQAYFIDKGIKVTKVYLVNAPEYPDTIIASIEQKIEATQKAIQRENELREATAEAAKSIAQAEGEAQAELARARATAEANALLEKSVTPAILQKLWIEKWNGVLPEVMPGDSALMMNM